MIERLQKSSDGTELSPEDESIARDAIGSAYGGECTQIQLFITTDFCHLAYSCSRDSESRV